VIDGVRIAPLHKIFVSSSLRASTLDDIHSRKKPMAHEPSLVLEYMEWVTREFERMNSQQATNIQRESQENGKTVLGHEYDSQ
jgi:hypothetical protein